MECPLCTLYLLHPDWYAYSPYHECKACNTEEHKTFEGVSSKHYEITAGMHMRMLVR